MNKLFGDLKTDEEKRNFFLSGRGYETGVIAAAIQYDVAMAYHRCAEYKKELAALQAPRTEAVQGEPECGCCGQTVKCDDDCDNAVLRKAEQQPSVQKPVGFVSQDFLEGKWSLDHIAKSDEGQISRTIPVFAKPPKPGKQPAPDVSELVEALECMIIGACAVAVPHNGERAVLQDAVNIARAALAAHRKQGGES